MIDELQSGLSPTPGQPAANSPSRYRWRRFLAVLFGVAGIFYLLPFLLLRMPGYDRWSLSQIGLAMDYGITTANINADVVVMGDSSALYGLDPRSMSSALHLKVINLANTMQGLPVTGDLELQHYLRSNARPKVILFYVAPWDFDYKHVKANSYYDGVEMLIRHGSLTENYAFFREHPISLLEFPFQFYAANSILAHLNELFRPREESAIVAALGHVPYASSNHLAASCEIPEEFQRVGSSVDSASSAWRRYQGAADHVMVVAAPAPDCKGIQAVMALPFSDAHASPPKILPPQSFADDGKFAHLLTDGSAIATLDVINAIRSVLASGGASDPQREVAPGVSSPAPVSSGSER